MFTAMHYIKQKYGIRGFYQGFAPAFLVYCAMSYIALKEATFDTYWIIKNKMKNTNDINKLEKAAAIIEAENKKENSK